MMLKTTNQIYFFRNSEFRRQIQEKQDEMESEIHIAPVVGWFIPLAILLQHQITILL